ncbi:hypothetical protein DFQ28_010039 [Apophysomyces sp. BC1034]|nr:hypothetical protein DFQ28_010039 [Apophysomyces sp. BC1034]
MKNFALLPDAIGSRPADVVPQPRARATRWLHSVLLAPVLVMAALAAVPATAHAGAADTMIKAVKFDDVDAVRKLLAEGVDPNLVDSGDMPMLVLAAREKSEKVATLLADQPRTDLEKLDRAGENAMMLASLNGEAGLVKHLIDKGAEVNKPGWTPLHYAATTGQDKLVKLLLDHSAYIDAASPNGTTPLMMASRGGNITTVKLLLDEGADLALKNQLGLSAIDFAKQYNQKDIADGLAARLETMQTQQRQKDSRRIAVPDLSTTTIRNTMLRALLRAIVMFSISVPMSAYAFTGADLDRLCQRTDVKSRASCEAYVEGAADGVLNTIEAISGTTGPRVGQYFCLPDNVKASELTDAVRKYLADTPRAKDYNASTVVALGLGKAYPCPPRK